MKMNADILNVILAVKAYRDFKYNDSIARGIHLEDLYDEQRRYYCSLPLPDGMKKNNEHFNYVLLISQDRKLVDMLRSCEENELSKYDFLRSV